MGDHQQGATGTLQIVLKIFYGIYVKMVRGFVHYEELGFRGQHLSQCNPLHLASRQFLHSPAAVPEAELRENAFDPPLIFPEMLLVQPRGEIPAALHYLRENLPLRVELILLFQECDAYILEKHYLASGVTLVLSGEYAHQGSLAGSVRCNEGDFVALIHIETYVLEKDFRPVGFRDVFDLQITCHIILFQPLCPGSSPLRHNCPG